MDKKWLTDLNAKYCLTSDQTNKAKKLRSVEANVLDCEIALTEFEPY